MSDAPELIPGFDVNGNPTLVQNPAHPSYSEGDAPVVVGRRPDGSFGYVVRKKHHPDARVDLARSVRDLRQAAANVGVSLVKRAREVLGR